MYFINKKQKVFFIPIIILVLIDQTILTESKYLNKKKIIIKKT